MRHILIAALAFTPSIICACAAFYLAANNINGWGYFLFTAAILGGSYSYKNQ